MPRQRVSTASMVLRPISRCSVLASIAAAGGSLRYDRAFQDDHRQNDGGPRRGIKAIRSVIKKFRMWRARHITEKISKNAFFFSRSRR